MKKIMVLILAAVMLLALASCGAKTEPAKTEPASTAAPATEAATEPATEPATEAATEPSDKFALEEKVDAFLDKYMCVTHYKLDITFNYAGASFTQENICAIIKEAAGLSDGCTVEIDEFDFEELLENYQGAGDGGGGVGNGFYWPEAITVTFSDPEAGETVEEEIAFSFRKCLPSSEIYPNGVLGTCPEDANETMKAAYPQLNTVAISDDVPAYDGYEGEYTEEAVSLFFRELTGLTDEDAYALYLVGFDPDKKGEPFYVLFSDKNAPDGKFDAVWVETAFN